MTIHLSLEDRELVQSLRAEGLTLSEISRVMGLSAPEVEEEKRLPGPDLFPRFDAVDWFRLHY